MNNKNKKRVCDKNHKLLKYKESAPIAGDNDTLTRVYDLNKNAAEIGLVQYTLPVTWDISVKANKVRQAIDLPFVLKEHRSVEVLVIKIVKLFAQLALLRSVQFKGRDEITRLVVGSDLHGRNP